MLLIIQIIHSLFFIKFRWWRYWYPTTYFD